MKCGYKNVCVALSNCKLLNTEEMTMKTIESWFENWLQPMGSLSTKTSNGTLSNETRHGSNRIPNRFLSYVGLALLKYHTTLPKIFDLTPVGTPSSHPL